MKHLSINRRQLLAATGATALLTTLTACSTGNVASSDQSATANSTDSFPITIDHVYGSTTLEKPALRVATVGWSVHDIVVGLGVLPVLMPTQTWGGNAAQSTDWFDAAAEKLGAKPGDSKFPTLYSDADGVDFTAMAKAAPDVILAMQSGLTKEDYTKLSAIAPTVPYFDVAWSAPWQKVIEVTGQALGKSAEAKKQVADTEAKLKQVGTKYPTIVGKSVISAAVSSEKAATIWIYSPKDARSQMLVDIGMKLAPAAYPANAKLSDFEDYVSPRESSRSEVRCPSELGEQRFEPGFDLQKLLDFADARCS